MRPIFAMLALLLFLVPGTSNAQGIQCSATMSNIVFGTVTIRSGVVNGTSGLLRLSCSGVASVGVCVFFGNGSGGGPPRTMRRADNAPLSYEIRRTGNGGTDIWTAEHFTVTGALFGATLDVPVYADITEVGFGAQTGSYSSVFSGDPDAWIEFNTPSCAEAGTERNIGTFSISADVAASCEIDAATLDFGTLGGPLASPVDATGQIILRCTDGAPYVVRLDNGVGAGATGPEDRRMESAGGQLAYGLYRDPARTLPWGTAAGNSVSATGQGVDQGINVYGRIYANQPLFAGAYSDSVLITVEY